MSTVPYIPNITLNPVATSNALNFYWGVPLNDGGSKISSYSLLCSSINFYTSINAASTYCKVTGLTENQNYTFQLAAVNSVGQGNFAQFAIAQPGIIPGGPRNFTLSTIDISTVNLVWTFSTNVDEGQNNYFGLHVIPQSSTISSYYQTVYQDQRSFQITNLPSSFYTFKLYSISDAGWSVDNPYNAVSTFTGY